MFLKSIEIHGFKSFANKIVFQFHNGITGIVGPNGSGKSNVADAVRWVLGEQSVKQLRGGSMQDVIFSGTELRKPLSYAFVAITLDNSDHQLPIDYEEVTVARRLYRSGESEYLLNGTVCRLKDVNELFYDTGIGKEGYSIIGQGQIDRILSGKPEERRELFDEAAGIVKYKRRKAAAIKKLENEQANLVRVKDILSELERQVGPLERQSEKAKVYLKYKEELKTLDVNAFLLEHQRLQKALEDLKAKLDLANGDLGRANAEFDGVRQEYDSIQATIEQLEAEIEEARTKLADTDLTRSKLEGQIELLKEQIHSSADAEALFLERQNALQQDIDQKNAEREQIQNDQDDLTDKAKEIDETAAQLHAELDEVQQVIAKLNQSIEEGKNIIISELNSRAAIQSKLARYDSMMEQISIRKAQLQSRILRAKSDQAARDDVIHQYEEEFESISEEMQKLHAQETQMDKEIVSLREELSRKDGLLREKQTLFHQEKSRLEALNDIAERYEGYGGSVKKVMEQKDKHPGIVGVVADIIKVEKRFETAIETALGGNIQNIVTRDEQTAKDLIAFLKEGKFGRATFLPMDSVTNPQKLKAMDVLDEKGVLGLAHTLVATDPEYADIAESLLGRFVVVDHIDHAVKIARKYHYTIRMVTLEGELLAPGGAISGGSFKNNSNFLGKKREMEEMEKKVVSLQDEIQNLSSEMEDIRSKRNQLRTALEQLKITIQTKTIAQNTARLNLSAARDRKDEEKENTLSLQQEQQSIEAEIIEIRDGKENAARDLQKSEDTENQKQLEIAAWQRDLEVQRQLESCAASKVSDWEIEVQKMRQSQSFRQENLDRIDGELEKLRQEMHSVEEALQNGRDMVAHRQQNILEIEETIRLSYSDQENKQDELREKMQQKETLSGKQKTFFDHREQLSRQISSLDKEVYRLNAQKERTQEAVEAQINYMWDEYEITLSDASSIRDESMTDLGQMKQSIGELKDKIRKLGDVNVNSIEEYKELSERYVTMKTQHDDLVQAAETLQGIVDELDASMRKLFTSKFAEINKEFDKVFKELFGGGKGTLELMEDEDILEAGIRIIAQPPGKKLQNMMQLSGGEKALSAIALLFAIQNLKPSPFCLLDEIEAALDDSNVGRYAKYLHKLTKYTQFIVITHRRGTMEQVDRLYGITMQEKGVSTLVSVNMIEKDLDN